MGQLKLHYTLSRHFWTRLGTPPATHHFWGTRFSKAGGERWAPCPTSPVTALHKRFSHTHSSEAPSGLEGHVTQENGPGQNDRSRDQTDPALPLTSTRVPTAVSCWAVLKVCKGMMKTKALHNQTRAKGKSPSLTLTMKMPELGPGLRHTRRTLHHSRSLISEAAPRVLTAPRGLLRGGDPPNRGRRSSSLDGAAATGAKSPGQQPSSDHKVLPPEKPSLSVSSE